MRIRLFAVIGVLVFGIQLVRMQADATPEPTRTPAGAPAGVQHADGVARLPQLHRKGRWLVDPQGRVVLLHGVNLVYKRAPYAPPDTAAGFTTADAEFLARYGFNAARLGVLWAGVDPTAPGEADPAYFAKVDRVADLLASRHVWTLYDAHQDQWSETYGGEGAPAWATHRPKPYSLLPVAKVPFPEGYWTPELSTLFDRFWAGRDGLLDDYADFWRQVAAHYRDAPWSAGYDLFNEPWAGLEWPACLTAGCKGSYARELQPAFTKMLRAVREVDPTSMVWFEPQQFFGGQKVRSFFTAVAGEHDLGFSWHNYCPAVFLQSAGLPISNVNSCTAYTDNRETTALTQARQMRASALMTEWGATDNLQALAIDAAGADRHAMGWTYWAYKHWDDPTTADSAQGLFTDDADLSSVKTAKLRLLVRTYPQATAGIPGPISFDPDTGAFAYRYRPDSAVTAPTNIFVSPLAYPDGWTVAVSGGDVVRRTARHVWIRATGTGPVRVHIVRTP